MLYLLLFTTSYPYDVAAEDTFLVREIPHLIRKFDRVILVPKIAKGNRLAVPSSVEVENKFSDYFEKNTRIFSIVLNALGSIHFYQELHAQISLLVQPFKLARLILFLGRAEIIRRWLNDWMRTHQENSDQIVFYSYWLNELVMGLGLVRQKYPDIKIVSRAHGYDIYEELYFPYYWPLRRQTLAGLDKLFPASYDGRDYFRNRYPEYHDLFETAHLGVEEPGFVSKSSADGVLRIISCANIEPRKRIDLLLEGIAYAARMRPEQKFEWHHFGGGQARRKLQKAVKNSFPHNATANLPGYVLNQEVLRHYKENPVDMFVNLSTNEGGAPVSIQEAISCGIPVIATSIGGNPEIVSERNGILLSPDPNPQEIANAIFVLLDNPEMAASKRRGSREVWSQQYNADVNFRLFAERLKSIREDQ